MQHEYDVAIIGAGVVGASLACSLAPAGLTIAVIEAKNTTNQQPNDDDRGIVLSHSSRRILEQLNIWEKLKNDLTPIKKIHVSEQGQFGFTRLDAQDIAMPALGYVIIARALGNSLHQHMAQFNNIQLLCPAKLTSIHRQDSLVQLKINSANNTQTITTRFVVGADGSHSKVRALANIKTKQRDFKQTAIVCNITTQSPNNNIAYERFTPHGPVALLPIGNHRLVMVLTIATAQAAFYLAMSNEKYKTILQQQWGRRLGNIQQIGRRQAYPIVLIKALEQYQHRLVLLGNAAHTIHPNAAQGFNLGLRDVAGLAECLLAARKNNTLATDDIRLLENYITLRAADQKCIIRFTSCLAACFYNQSVPLQALRNTAMLCVDNVPALKRVLIKKMAGLAGLQPAMARGQNIYDTII